MSPTRRRGEPTGQATIKDIARRLGIAPSTVSRALRDHPDVGASRKAEIQRVAAELDYQPDSIAQSLKSRRTRTIAVMVPEIKHQFFSEVLDGVEEAAFQAGYTVLVCKSNEDPERERVNARALVAQRVAGLAVSVSQTTTDGAHLRAVQRHRIPVVLFDRILEDVAADRVVVDDYEAALGAVAHLLERGYRRIAHLAGPPRLYIAKERLRGYQAALERAGVPLVPELVVAGGLDQADGVAGLGRLLACSSPPDALLAVNDPVALGVHVECRRRGLRIPEDLAIVGFSGNAISALLEPPLTTVVQPAHEVGLVVGRLLLERIAAKAPRAPRTERLKTTLVVRGSS